MNIDHQALRTIVAKALSHAGTDVAHAQTVADHLVEANLKGHDSHGVGLIPMYLANVRHGILDPRADPEVILDRGAVLLVDGHQGFGQRIAREATDMAIERAASTGLVCLGLRNAHHIARIGSYAEQCTAAGLVSIHFVNVVGHDPMVAPWGGREGRMQTNPFCTGIPVDGGDPIILDMATSAIAQGKVRVAHQAGTTVPDGALIDAQGNPTNDPAVLFDAPIGALSPFGMHKGTGLALVCELLGGGLAGHWTMQPENQRAGNIINNMLMFVLDPDLFGGRDTFLEETQKMVTYLKSSATANGFDEVLTPGEPERRSKAQREKEGIPLPDVTWKGIVKAAIAVGMEESEINELL